METDIKRLFQIRVGVYNALRHFFYYGPEENNVRELSSLIASYLNVNKFSKKDMSVENVGKLQEEYTRLFIGPGKVPISLYETAYRQPKALLMQETAVHLRNQYLASGMVVDGVVNLPEDHLAIELEFIYALAADTLEILDKSDSRQLLTNLEKQREFIQGRIDWVEALVVKVDEHSRYTGINAVFHLLTNFIQEDLSFISSIIDENPI